MTTQDIDLGVVARGPQGPQGKQGNVGPAPTLKIGTVTKLNPDQAPTANLSGGNGTYTLNMGIPQGVQGETNATATNALNVANGVDSKVTAIQANGGGRNLLRNSNVELHGKAYSLGGTPLTIDHLEAGETYTMSWYGKVDANATKHKQPLQVYIYNASWGWAIAGTIPYTANEYQRNVFTFTVPNNVTDVDRVEFYLKHYNDDNSQGSHDKDDDAGIGYVKNYMLEKGIVAHDWSPAPEDIQYEIDANKTATANAQNTANSALSKANSNATALNNKANKSDLTWANISGKPSIPSTFNGSITDTSTDFNNLTSEGHYCIDISPSCHGKNGPNEDDWGLLDVKVAGRMVVQTYYGDQKGNVYVRNRRDGSTWTAWRQITFWS